MVRHSGARLDVFNRLYQEIERGNTPRDIRVRLDEGEFLAALMTTTAPKTYYYAERVEAPDEDGSDVFLAARFRPSWSKQRAPKSPSDFQAFERGNRPERLTGVDVDWAWGNLPLNNVRSETDLPAKFKQILFSRREDCLHERRKVTTDGQLKSQYKTFRTRAIEHASSPD